MSSLDQFPRTLKGGYYDGARLVGVRTGGRDADYYNPESHGLVTYYYNEEKGRLDRDGDPEQTLPADQSIGNYVATEMEQWETYEALSEWVKSEYPDR